MPTNTIILSDTFVKISDGKSLSQPSNNILIGFGSVIPTQSLMFHPAKLNEFINYNGDFGAMWAKRVSENQPASIIVTVA